MKRKRIGHLYQSPKSAERFDDWDTIPRGWISPRGQFMRTNTHWVAISKKIGRVAKSKDDVDPEVGEKFAHLAYSKGWVSVGHGGVLNAIGHETVFASLRHPAIATLRRLIAKLPHSFIRIEKQMGAIDDESGKHEDFDVTEYDLGLFIKRGRLKKHL